MSPLALLAEEADVEVDDVVEELVAHALQRARAHVLDRPRPQVAEGVRQQVHQYGDRGQQDQHVHGVVGAEQRGVSVAHPRAERRLAECELGARVERLEAERGVEHRLDDRDEHDVVDRVEQRVEDRVDEVGGGVFADGAHEGEQAEVCLEHLGRNLVCGRHRSASALEAPDGGNAVGAAGLSSAKIEIKFGFPPQGLSFRHVGRLLWCF